MGTPRLSTQILDNRDVLDAVPQMAERSEGSERSRRERKLNTKYTDEDFVGEGSSRGGIHATNNTSHSSQAVCRFAGSGRQKQKRIDFDHGSQWLGHRVVVYWQSEAAHYPAIIDDHDNKDRYHLIYDDGHEEWRSLPSDDVIFMPLGWHEDGGTGEWESLVQKRNKTSPSVRCTKGRPTPQPRQVQGTVGGGSSRAGNEQRSAWKKSEVRGVDKEGVCVNGQGLSGYWPAVNDKVEVKKNLGVALGWQWCHGRCIKVDRGSGMFRVRISHNVHFKGEVIVRKNDEAWYPVKLGWRDEATDPDHNMSPVWPKNGRYVSMSDETVNMISRRYMCNPKEVVSLNVGRVPGLRPGALLYEGTILQLPQNSEFVQRPVGTDLGKWDQLNILVQERLEASPCLGHKSATNNQRGGVEDGGQVDSDLGQNESIEHKYERRSLGDLQAVVKGVQEAIKRGNRTGRRSLVLLLNALSEDLDQCEDASARWRSEPLLDWTWKRQSTRPDGRKDEAEAAHVDVGDVTESDDEDLIHSGAGADGLEQYSGGRDAREETSADYSAPKMRRIVVTSTQVRRAQADDELNLLPGYKFCVLDPGKHAGWIFVQKITSSNESDREVHSSEKIAQADLSSYPRPVERGFIPTCCLQTREASWGWQALAIDELSFNAGTKFVVLGRAEDEGWLLVEMLSSSSPPRLMRGVIPETHLAPESAVSVSYESLSIHSQRLATRGNPADNVGQGREKEGEEHKSPAISSAPMELQRVDKSAEVSPGKSGGGAGLTLAASSLLLLQDKVLKETTGKEDVLQTQHGGSRRGVKSKELLGHVLDLLEPIAGQQAHRENSDAELKANAKLAENSSGEGMKGHESTENEVKSHEELGPGESSRGMYLDLLGTDGNLREDKLSARNLRIEDLAERLFSWSGLLAHAGMETAANEFCRLRNAIEHLAKADYIGIAALLGLRVELTNLEVNAQTSDWRNNISGMSRHVTAQDPKWTVLDQIAVLLTSPCEQAAFLACKYRYRGGYVGTHAKSFSRPSQGLAASSRSKKRMIENFKSMQIAWAERKSAKEGEKLKHNDKRTEKSGGSKVSSGKDKDVEAQSGLGKRREVLGAVLVGSKKRRILQGQQETSPANSKNRPSNALAQRMRMLTCKSLPSSSLVLQCGKIFAPCVKSVIVPSLSSANVNSGRSSRESTRTSVKRVEKDSPESYTPRLMFSRAQGTLLEMVPLYGQDRDVVVGDKYLRDDRAIDLFGLIKYGTEQDQQRCWKRIRLEIDLESYYKKQAEKQFAKLDPADPTSVAQHLVFLSSQGKQPQKDVALRVVREVQCSVMGEVMGKDSAGLVPQNDSVVTPAPPPCKGPSGHLGQRAEPCSSRPSVLPPVLPPKTGGKQAKKLERQETPALTNCWQHMVQQTNCWQHMVNVHNVAVTSCAALQRMVQQTPHLQQQTQLLSCLPSAHSHNVQNALIAYNLASAHIAQNVCSTANAKSAFNVHNVAPAFSLSNNGGAAAFSSNAGAAACGPAFAHVPSPTAQERRPDTAGVASEDARSAQLQGHAQAAAAWPLCAHAADLAERPSNRHMSFSSERTPSSTQHKSSSAQKSLSSKEPVLGAHSPLPLDQGSLGFMQAIQREFAGQKDALEKFDDLLRALGLKMLLSASEERRSELVCQAREAVMCLWQGHTGLADLFEQSINSTACKAPCEQRTTSAQGESANTTEVQQLDTTMRHMPETAAQGESANSAQRQLDTTKEPANAAGGQGGQQLDTTMRDDPETAAQGEFSNSAQKRQLDTTKEPANAAQEQQLDTTMRDAPETPSSSEEGRRADKRPAASEESLRLDQGYSAQKQRSRAQVAAEFALAQEVGDMDDRNNDYCEVCGDGGELICCDVCERAYHGPECLDATANELADPYKCPSCCGTLAAVKAEYQARRDQSRSAKEGGAEAGSRAIEPGKESELASGQLPAMNHLDWTRVTVPKGGMASKCAGARTSRGHAAGKKPKTVYWSNDEHSRFLQGVKLYGRKSFKDIAAIVGTRTHLQVPFMFVIRISKGIDHWDKLVYRVKTHAQKYFQRLMRQSLKSDEGDSGVRSTLFESSRRFASAGKQEDAGAKRTGQDKETQGLDPGSDEITCHPDTKSVACVDQSPQGQSLKVQRKPQPLLNRTDGTSDGAPPEKMVKMTLDAEELLKEERRRHKNEFQRGRPRDKYKQRRSETTPVMATTQHVSVADQVARPAAGGGTSVAELAAAAASAEKARPEIDLAYQTPATTGPANRARGRHFANERGSAFAWPSRSSVVDLTGSDDEQSLPAGRRPKQGPGAGGAGVSSSGRSMGQVAEAQHSGAGVRAALAEKRHVVSFELAFGLL